VSNAGAVIRSFRRPVRTENETDGTNVLLSAAVSHGPFQAVIFRRPVRLRSCAERLETIRTTRFFAPIAVTRTRIISPVRVCTRTVAVRGRPIKITQYPNIRSIFIAVHV